MLLAICSLALAAAVEPALATAPQASDLVAIRARKILTGAPGDGATIENGTILIEGGKIRAVGAKLDIPAAATVIDHDGVVTAGMIALRGTPGTQAPRNPHQGLTFILGEAQADTRPPPLHVEEVIEEEPLLVDLGEQPQSEGDAEQGGGGAGHVAHEHGDDEVERATPPPAREASFVDAFEAPYATSFAARNDGGDSTRVAIPGAELVHAFDPHSPDFEDALAAGITTVVLTPRATSLAPGQSATVKTTGGRVLAPHAQLSLGFSSAALEPNRAPTSFSGALAELEQRFSDREGPFADAKAGKLSVVFDVSSRQDALRAAEFAKRHGLKGAVSGGDWIGEVAEAVHGAGLSAVVGPYAFGTTQRTLRSTIALAEAGVPIGFGLDAPRYGPSMLRVSAAMCVREGLDRATAWGALTRTAADIAGVGNQVGRIEKGFDADLVFWSGDPLDLASRVETVMVDGKIARGGAQ